MTPKPNNEWEERFEKELCRRAFDDILIWKEVNGKVIDPHLVKFFISQLLSSERQRLIERIRGMIDEKMLMAEEPMDDESRAIKLKSIVANEILKFLEE